MDELQSFDHLVCQHEEGLHPKDALAFGQQLLEIAGEEVDEAVVVALMGACSIAVRDAVVYN